jgi:hypothetical protein
MSATEAKITKNKINIFAENLNEQGKRRRK